MGLTIDRFCERELTVKSLNLNCFAPKSIALSSPEKDQNVKVGMIFKLEDNGNNTVIILQTARLKDQLDSIIVGNIFDWDPLRFCFMKRITIGTEEHDVYILPLMLAGHFEGIEVAIMGKDKSPFPDAWAPHVEPQFHKGVWHAGD